ncbi:hypothetical protein LY76DRAFT_38249 [Colletotrichum caudatum]|nr:hypothetical protein LY76DRAFT_38249 [Colletotrichum caudatum]
MPVPNAQCQCHCHAAGPVSFLLHHQPSFASTKPHDNTPKPKPADRLLHRKKRKRNRGLGQHTPCRPSAIHFLISIVKIRPQKPPTPTNTRRPPLHNIHHTAETRPLPVSPHHHCHLAETTNHDFCACRWLAPPGLGLALPFAFPPRSSLTRISVHGPS